MKHVFFLISLLMTVLAFPGNAQTTGTKAMRAIGVTLEYDSTASFTVEAGTPIHFALSARDENLDVVEDWDQTGHSVYLTVHDSRAEMDTSTRSWSKHPDGYSWLKLRLNDTLLTQDSVSIGPNLSQVHFTIPASAFSSGRASLTFIQSQADRGIVITVAPWWSHLVQQSPPITVRHGVHENYLARLTTPTQGPDKVFLLRRYELVVGPRDRYLNIIDDTNVATGFTARFPSEFDTSQLGTQKIFSGPVYIRGISNYFVASSVRRIDAATEERQWIRAIALDDSTVSGRTDPYEIIDHAPNPFALVAPADETELRMYPFSDMEQFTWTKAKPQDPYTNIQMSMFDPATVSDVVTYQIRFLDAASLTRTVVYDADDDGKDTSWSTTHAQLWGLIDMISGIPTMKELEVVWYVKATDGLYVTLSSPPNNDVQGRPGYRLKLVKLDPGLDVPSFPENSGFILQQNYPNPFNPSTTITVDMEKSGTVRLSVHNLVGEPVTVLHDGFLEAGEHHFHLHADGLPSGVYTYRLEMDGTSVTRYMLLLR